MGFVEHGFSSVLAAKFDEEIAKFHEEIVIFNEGLGLEDGFSPKLDEELEIFNEGRPFVEYGDVFVWALGPRVWGYGFLGPRLGA